jgi:hypothetical protein
MTIDFFHSAKPCSARLRTCDSSARRSFADASVGSAASEHVELRSAQDYQPPVHSLPLVAQSGTHSTVFRLSAFVIAEGEPNDRKFKRDR